MPPDITSLDPVHPVEALRSMAEDRLQALGTSGQAVFGITNASLTQQDDVITCALAVELEIYPTPGIRSGFAQAIVSRQHTGSVDDLRAALYDITKATMDAMNVEFEYQVRRNLAPWLVSATPGPVQQQPLQTAPTESPPEEQLPGAPPPGEPPLGEPLCSRHRTRARCSHSRWDCPRACRRKARLPRNKKTQGLPVITGSSPIGITISEMYAGPPSP